MLQKAFFKVDVVDRIYDTLVFEKTTPGAYEFTIPDGYNYVVIEYAGAGGGNSDAYNGCGSVIKNKFYIHNKEIYGIIGSKGLGVKQGDVNTGGTGYNNGEKGAKTSLFGSTYTISGGGGSTSVNYNNNIYEASAGGGASGAHSGEYGGKGGGQYGGARQTTLQKTGNNATDPGKIGLNPGDGYVKIWAGYDPYFKG